MQKTKEMSDIAHINSLNAQELGKTNSMYYQIGELYINLHGKDGEEGIYMAFCGNCGTPVGKDKFCPQCGAPIENRTKKEKAVRLYERLKRRELLFGIALVVFGLIIGENWGETSRETQRYWYTVHSTELNAIGWICVVAILAGAVICIAWIIAFIVMKVSIPCPQCGGLLLQHPKVCPHCKTKLDWGDDFK